MHAQSTEPAVAVAVVGGAVVAWVFCSAHSECLACFRYTKLHLAGLGQVQLRKLARENKLDTGGGIVALRQRLSALRLAVGADKPVSTLAAAGAVSESEVTAAGAAVVASHPNVTLKLGDAVAASDVFKCPTKNAGLQTVFSGGDLIAPSRVRLPVPSHQCL